MPIDPYFTSHQEKRTYSEADKAQWARLRALPRNERYATYARLKQLQEERTVANQR